MDDGGRKTGVEHWDTVWSGAISKRLPSSLNVSIWDIKRFLKRHLRPGFTYLEIGCAPGGMLAWAAATLKVEVSGLDYSQTGTKAAIALFRALGLKGDIRCEDAFNHTFSEGSFDVVTSFGVIEHFDDPRAIIRQHVLLVRAGGKALISVPNYGGVYGRLQKRFDPENLKLHNLDVMDLTTLRSFAPFDLAREVKVYREGRLSPWLVNVHHRLPMAISKRIYSAANILGLFQPFKIAPISSMVVLEVIRK
jgi:2-polyprenyl-3-methyl-5-hydroxy-6-metoxy-1,4-benzoquinol methylase